MTERLYLVGWVLAAVGMGLALGFRWELRRRRELVARASHELRGPLGAARLMLATMGRRAEAPERRLAGLDLELRRAASALDDFAAARRGGHVALHPEVVAVAELLEEQRASWSVVARGFEAELRLGAVAPDVVVRGDRVRLAQAVGNLVGNAVEHAGGRVELSAHALPGRVRIEVADEGPGLPAPLFELVRRPRAGRGRRGRGLAIASQIARRHGGRLAAAPPAAGAPGARIGLELPVPGIAP